MEPVTKSINTRNQLGTQVYLYGSDGGGGRDNLGLSLRSRCDEDGPLRLLEAAEDMTLPVVPKPILLTSGVLLDRAS